MITSSPALLAREREVFETFTGSLARLLAQETGAEPGDVEPWVAANALMGVHRALVHFTRTRVLEGAAGGDLAAEVEARGVRALTALADGLDGYAIR